MDSTLILSVIAGLGMGVVLILAFASMPLTDGKSFRPDGHFDWSPEDGGLPRLWLTDENEDNTGKFMIDNSGNELNDNPFG